MFTIPGVIQQEAILDKEVSFYRSHAYAESTKAVYRCQLHTYLRFCIYFGYAPLPATTVILCRYATFLARSLKPSSIDCYMNIIRILHKESGLPNPLEDNWITQTVIRGIKRRLGSPPLQKLPITPSILLSIHQRLDLSSVYNKAFWAACLCAFFTFFRKATLLPKSLGKSGINTGLRRKDIQFTDQGVTISTSHTKTIQYGQRMLLTPLPIITGSPLCPTTALKELIKCGSSIPEDAPLFSYPSANSDYLSLSHTSFVHSLKLILTTCGYPASEYSGHSFRRGGASFAFQCGIPPTVIKMQGDWRSMAYERYLYVPLEYKQDLVKVLSLKLKN